MQRTPTHTAQQTEVMSISSHASHNIYHAICSLGSKFTMFMVVTAATALSVNHVQADEHRAGNASNTSSIAQREIARRAGLVVDADKALMLGREAYAKKNFEEAVKHYRIAINLLPPGPALADRRHSYTGHLGDATVALAQQYRRSGRYDEARTILEGLMLRDPANFAAKKQLEYLDDPIRTNPALTYEHTQNVDRVRKHLYMGEGYYNLGQYDKAEGEFKKVLLIDSYNKAARRWLEKVVATKSDYYRAAYDHTRAELLKEVDRAWETTVPPELPNFGAGEASTARATGVQYLQQKLNNIILPRVDFDNVTVQECLEILRLRANEFDPEPDQNLKGINFYIRDPGTGGDSAQADGDEAALDAAGGGESIGNRRIDELRLNNVPLGTVLQYVCDKTRLRYKLDEYTVILLPLEALDVNDLYTRTFVVPPDFISRLAQGGGSGDNADSDPFGGGDDDAGGTALKQRPSSKQLLMENGVSFPDKSFANYIAATSTLVVYNTLGNLDIIEQIIEVLRKGGPRQVRIMTKFIEVKQENTDELGYDWIINPFPGQGAAKIAVAGGTLGNGSRRTPADFGNPSILPLGSQTVSNTSTSGLRSGDFAVTRNNIDSILNNPNRTSQSEGIAPGILSITGLFDDGNAQMILRGLAQKKGTDVMSAPSILARSGEAATIEVIREFIYPTEYEPPEIPTGGGGGGGGGNDDGGGGGGGGVFPVTPATPTAFETRNTGVTLEILPTIGENDYTIDLSFAPELVEFEGFINYGSPIQSFATDAVGNPITITITENRIEMPVFAARKVKTALTIYDGYTVAVGGLMREDIQNVEDKVPVLGDLPLIGRLFTSKTENHIKSNLIIFVTAEIIDAAGARINQPTSGAAGAGGVAPQAQLPLDAGAGLLPPMPAR